MNVINIINYNNNNSCYKNNNKYNMTTN